MTVTERGELTPRQRDVYDWIARFRQKNGAYPTVREIMRDMDMTSPNGVTNHLRPLEKKGWLRRAGRRARMMALATVEDKIEAPPVLEGYRGPPTARRAPNANFTVLVPTRPLKREEAQELLRQLGDALKGE